MRKLVALVVAIGLLCAGSAMAETTSPITDSEGNFVGVEVFDDQGRLIEDRYGVSETNPLGDDQTPSSQTKYAYDSEGNLSEISFYQDGQYTGKQTAEYSGNTNSWKEYDANGALAFYGETTYDEATNSSSGITYNADGSVNSTHFWDGNSSVTLDGNGNLLYAWTDGADYDAYTGKWHDENGNEVPAKDVSALIEKAKERLKKDFKPVKPEEIWYTNNTACVPGIRLRDEYPDLTSKWYNVLPVDLSRDGTQTFDLVASNLYYLGKVQVTVNGDEVVVNYGYLNNPTFNIVPVEECYTWFTGMEQITTEYLENPTSDLKYGQAISKEKDLNGQETALLFVCNRVSYRTPLNTTGAMPIRYWPNSEKHTAYFSNVKSLLEKNEAEYAQKKAEAEAAAAAAAETAAETEAPASGN